MRPSGSSWAASVGVRTIVAPRAFKTTSFSILIFSGIVIIKLYPLTADARARPIPVFPEVGSIRVSPGLMRPSFSASSTILKPIRSFRDPPAFKNSHFANKLHSKCDPILFNCTTGVCPIASRMVFNDISFLSIRFIC